MPLSDDAAVRDLLELNRIAVVGCSSSPGKAAHEIPAYLQRQGYEIIPVNPFADEILGKQAVDSLAEIDGEIDLVDVFRPSEEVAGIVDDAIERRETEGDVEAIWLQLGIHDDEAVTEAEAAGLSVVEDRCMKVEHQRLVE
ncbi:CoA-binding protein [Halohasta litorea]|uniref:CoA-binding protein n=1 Tax=Halohasta litorea TaxID=869891 RepID=A0ABD6D5A4_9EURY|nr:CoA-binding protein [Halohasta litorea]MEA1932063.1 CoA-binding protein [Euryarchaeota archaeon]